MGKHKAECGRARARPSSSSTAASLLPFGTSALGFGGYVGNSRLDPSISSEIAVSCADVDTEMTLHLRRLCRKDPTTKLKALTSLSSLFKQKSANEILPIIQKWAFEYKKLLLDYNREVRRTTHDTMTNLVVALGRDLAPHLRTLIGPWWVFQFDRAPEVASAAKQSFQSAFTSQEKKVDVLVLCINEILAYLEENLNLTSETVSDAGASVDEKEEMYQQVISSSLLALASILDVLVGMQLETPSSEMSAFAQTRHSKAKAILTSLSESILASHNFFLDFLKCSSPLIRAASYSLLSSCTRNIPSAFKEESFRAVATAILGALQEKDPTCHPSMWDAIISFSKEFPKSWSSVNITKTVLSRLWHFLRRGCFGSQQISYPALIIFLDAVPPEAMGEKFLLDFFLNLWAGKNSSSSAEDRQSLFMAFKECFTWAFQNTSRYCDGPSTYLFRLTLTNEILVKILWHDYISNAFSEMEKVSTKSIDSEGRGRDGLQRRIVEAIDFTNPTCHQQDLGICIIDILSVLHCWEHNLLSVFGAIFRQNCIEVCEENENMELKNTTHINEILDLLDRLVARNGETWPLECIVGPMLAELFTFIMMHESVNGAWILTVCLSTFGPHKVFQAIFFHNKTSGGSGDIADADENRDCFLRKFKEIFIPWCLHARGCSINARLDVLLHMLVSDFFTEQWGEIITFATGAAHFSSSIQLSNRLEVLAMLIEKAKVRKSDLDSSDSNWKGSCPEYWHHDLLDSAAVSAICCPPENGMSTLRFMRSVLGGTIEADSTCFLSKNAVVMVFEIVLQELLYFMKGSPFSWVKDNCILLSSRSLKSLQVCTYEFGDYKKVQLAFNVLTDSLFCLKGISNENDLISGILAAIFILSWEYSLAEALPDGFFIDCKDRKEILASVHTFHCKASKDFWRNFSMTYPGMAGYVLIQCIQSVIVREDEHYCNKMVSLCCGWILEVLEYLCHDEHEIQMLLCHLLKGGDSWPKWVLPDFGGFQGLATVKYQKPLSEKDVRVNYRFADVIDELISTIGFATVIFGSGTCPLHSAETKTVQNDSEAFYSRPWLVAEMLCNWRWNNGSALSSFLPSLSIYFRSLDFSQSCSLASALNILLDGAILHGTCIEADFLNVFTVSRDELNGIGEEFLRGFLSLVLTLFDDGIWRIDRAPTLFRLCDDRLFVDEFLNRNCLRVLSPVLRCLSRPLSAIGYSAEHENDRVSFQFWLQKALSLPSLLWWQNEEDIEEWYELVVSCYPMDRTVGGVWKAERDISIEERVLLLELFRNQRCNCAAPEAASNMDMAQLLLSELMVISVGYCSKEFIDEDWMFVISWLMTSIKSVVLLMENLVEGRNEIVANKTSANLLAMGENLRVSNISSSSLNMATHILITFSLLHDFLGDQKTGNDEYVNPLVLKRWNCVNDGIAEAVLQVLLCAGVAEFWAFYYSNEALSIISCTNIIHSRFCELVALSTIKSSPCARRNAIGSFVSRGVKKDAICSLFAVLFSPRGIPSLKGTAYNVLSREPVSDLAMVGETSKCLSDNTDAQRLFNLALSSECRDCLREEIRHKIEKLPTDILETDVAEHDLVNSLLAWALLLSYISSSQPLSVVKERIIQFILERSDPSILDCIFHCIPLDPYLSPSSKRKEDAEVPSVLLEAAKMATRAIESGSLSFSIEGLWPIIPEKMALLSGSIFGMMLRILPAYVRRWFGDIRDHSASSMIKSFVRTWCSPSLIADELSQIRKATFTDNNFSISVSKSANEAVATYTKEDTGIDLVIRFPATYPLQPVDVDCTRSLGISEVKQRRWLMSMTSFIRNQNGALAEAIRIWKSNFDKEFEGVEECPICYSIIHTANHRMPSMPCKTCRHKFHSACLYKWFSTSHKSTCPLCQSPF